MSLHDNLVAAEAAINHVRSVCGMRADNYDQPQFANEGAPEGAVGRARADAGTLRSEMFDAMLRRFDAIQAPELAATLAKLGTAKAQWDQIKADIATLGAAKKPVPKEMITENQRLMREWNVHNQRLAELDASRTRSMGNMGVIIRHRALAAIHRKAGNCMEQSAIVFCYLQGSGVRPLDYYYASGANADHQWVVIGRVKGSSAADPDKWGAEAVICDPWDKTWYAATEFDTQMHALGQAGLPGSEFRLD